MAGRGRSFRPRFAAVFPLVAVPLLLGMSYAIIITAVTNSPLAARSSYVQAHGLRESATVVHVDTDSRSANVTVRLRSPVKGVTSIIVGVRHNVSSSPGETITVLVDPSQPDYAELPGSPNATPTYWPSAITVVGVVLAVAAFLVYLFVRDFRKRRAMRASLLHSSSG